MKNKDIKEEIEEINKIVSPDKEILLEKDVKVQYNKNNKTKTGQYLIRFPKEMEDILGLSKKRLIKIRVKIPSDREEKPRISMEVI
jgi:hypothetical protein